MEKFVSYEKLSKKKQNELNAAKRGNWGLVKPVTKVKPSASCITVKRRIRWAVMAVMIFFYRHKQDQRIKNSLVLKFI